MQIVVLGSGPAGSVAAHLLGTWGHEVVVLTRAAQSERAIGESLPPSCVSLLDRIGIRDLDTAGFLRSTGNTVRWGATERVEPFAEGRWGYQVDRPIFDAFLGTYARTVADVRVANVIRIERDGSSSTVTFDRDGVSDTIHADWVLDCTGRTGMLARTGWRRADGPRTTAIVGVWERDDAWPTSEPTHTIVESGEDGWAWSVPVSSSRRYVTLMVDPTRTTVATRERLQSDYLEQLSRTRSLASLTQGATLQAVFARDASSYTSDTFADHGALLVGDAASFVDPLSSFGIKKAVASAWLASIVVHSIITEPSIATAALELFNRREAEMYESLKRSAAAIARDASSAHPTAFWESRASASESDLLLEPDVAALRSDADVLRAFEDLRARQQPLRLRHRPGVQRIPRPTVRGNRVSIEDHLVSPAFPRGVRYIRNVDLVRLSEIAPSHAEVPELFEAYNRLSPPVPLPDFLGALSLLIGKGVVEHA